MEGGPEKKLFIPKIRSLDLRTDEAKTEVGRVQELAKEHKEKLHTLHDEFSKVEALQTEYEFKAIGSDEEQELGHTAEEISKRCHDMYAYFYHLGRNGNDINAYTDGPLGSVNTEKTANIEKFTPDILKKMKEIIELYDSYNKSNKRIARKQEFVQGLFNIQMDRMDFSD